MRPLVAAAALVLMSAGVAESQQVGEWTLDPVAVIGGSLADDPRYTFHDVTDAGVAGREDGGLLVLDVQGRRVLEYDAGGHHVRTFGRPGDGPGELKFPTALTVVRGDSVLVLDVARLTAFPGTGGAPRTEPLIVRTFGRIRGWRGEYVRAVSAPLTSASGAGASPGGVSRMHLGRFTQTGALHDTIWSGPFPKRVLLTVTSGSHTTSTHATEQYGATTHWDQLGDGTLVVADTTAYLIRLISRNGMVAGTLGPGEAARPVTSADRSRALERLRTAQARGGGAFQAPDALRRKVLEETPFAAVVPRIAGLAVDPHDRIWVGVSGPGGEIVRLDVYDRGGRLLGRLADPPGMPAALYGDGLVAFLERDELDTQQIRIMRVAPR